VGGIAWERQFDGDQSAHHPVDAVEDAAGHGWRPFTAEFVPLSQD
jgi:hypothetical protein